MTNHPNTEQPTRALGVAPHRFHPNRPWDLFYGEGWCSECYLPRNAHPIRCAVPARQDDRPAELRWDHLHLELPDREAAS